ncbi:MAG: discoidin domain-containing protein, partial [Candidatus Omnitrophica bacterium]|nr:discoidin domain-containing protein [Candidatus Omnitrophota bacterium]
MKKIIFAAAVFAILIAPAYSFAYAMRINCGGTAYTAVNGDFYIADREYTQANGAGYTGGSAGSAAPNAVENTQDDSLYLTDRYGSFDYKFDLANGYYNVTLRFAETYFPAPGFRKFRIFLENNLVYDNFDPCTGGWYRAVDLNFIVKVEDGQLNITFGAIQDLPKLCAVSVANIPKPQSTGPVRISGRNILLNGEKFIIKGAGYQPVPVGYDVNEYDVYNTPGIYNRDLPLLRAMNCNVIRTWGKVNSMAFLDACWNGGTDPIYVVMGFHPWNEANIDPNDPNNTRQDIINEFKDYVNTYKNHPAVLMWAVGNENNYWQAAPWNPSMTHEELMRCWYSLVNDLALAAYDAEGVSYHPVTHPNGAVYDASGPIGSTLYKTDDASMPYLDVWGANVYTAWSLDDSITNYQAASSKPFWISEYGFRGDNQRYQAEGADILWEEILEHYDTCSGSSIMAYSDEWWKYNDPAWTSDEKRIHLGIHDIWLYNEEFWGLVGVEGKDMQSDNVYPKLVYYRLKEQWAPDNEKSNLAFNKPASASSVEPSSGYTPDKAVDGNINTRWSSEASDIQWLCVDLGGVHSIGRVVIRWENAYAAAYEIQVSNDAANWTTVYSTSSGAPYTNFIYLDGIAARGRYIRLYCTQRATSRGYSLYEFKVFEPIAENAAIGKTAFTSVVENNDPQLAGAKAIDGNFATRWSSGITNPETPLDAPYEQWIYVDLGAYYDISQVVLRWEQAYAHEYKIQKSYDGNNWTDIHTETNGNGTDDYINFSPSVQSRYIRLYCIKRGAPYGYSLWEFQINGIISLPPDEPCQIGAFIADWAKEATFPWNGNEGITKFEDVIQREVACVKLYHKITDDFPFRDCLTIYNHGTHHAVPFIDIHPSTSDADTAPHLLEIINGVFDDEIHNWARQARAFGKPLWISFDGEMNGDWHSGSGAANGGSTLDGYGDPAKADGPEIYIDAWRHIHDIFDAEGVDNVAWVWSVYAYDWPQDSWNHFENYYPGDAYVDWLSVHGYNWNRAELGGWQSFQTIFNDALGRIHMINSEKPVMIGEFGCADGEPGQKSTWITDAFNLIKTTYDYIKCAVWFDMNKEENWLIDSDGNVAPRTALSDPYFTSSGDPGTAYIKSFIPPYEKRFNCGGSSYTAVNGDYYAADQTYTSENGAGVIGASSPVSTTITIDGTTDDPLYQTARQGGNFQYKFDVPNGRYEVKLQFAEIVHGEPPSRSFLVLINDAVVKGHLSTIYGAAGGMYKAYDLEFFTNVTNGQLIVEFRAAPGNPEWDVTGIINAISVVTSKPASEGSVKVSGRQILLSDQPFTIKGTCYQPIPIGSGINEYNFYTDSDIYNRDFQILRDMKCNAVRTWGKVGYYDEHGSFLPAAGFMDAAYNEGINPIYVIMGFHVDGSLNLADPAIRQNVIDEFKLYVHLYRNHPAVLMWAVGNENNYWYPGDKKDWYSLVDELAWAAYEVEGKSYHPVTTPNGDIWNSTGPIGNRDFKTNDNSMPYLDVWGANIYSGWSFQNRIQTYAGLSSKPFWISEYGFPGTDERNQAEGARVLWEEMARNSNICSGGTIMEYSDEWWKSGTPDRHNDSDGVEFFGVVSAEDNGSAADIMHPKPAYYVLQEAWGETAGKNIAFGKNAYVSSVEEGSGHIAANVIDRNFTTRWSSVASDPQWIYIDLGETHAIGSVALWWEAAYAAAYEIQVSDNASDWTTVDSVSGGDGYNDF